MKDTNTNETYATWQSKYGDYANSMTLRDYFAAKAMQGVIAHRGGLLPDWAENKEEVAAVCYRFAAAMLEARNQS
jgi:hypothetical protein